MKILKILIILGILVQTTFAKKDSIDVIKIGGTLEVGFDKNYKANKETTNYNRIGKAQIDISGRPAKDVRAEIGIEYNHKDSLFSIDKLYGQYNFAKFSAIRFGYMKKSFGLEERNNLDGRYLRKRSIISDSLEYLGFLNHDLTLQYRHDLSKKWLLRGGFSWTADSTRYLQNYSIEYGGKKNNLVLATIIRHYLPQDKDAITTFVSSLSYKRSAKLYVSETEFVLGSNPAIKVFEDRDAFIFGARVQENFPIEVNAKILQKIIPIAEAAFYTEDLDGDTYDTQLRAGITFGFSKKSSFQWRNNYGVVSRTKEGEKELWRRRLDSEVVVIF